MAETVIELKDVSFSSRGVDIVKNISCSFPQGSATALAGPSGGGKSTVLKLAAGLLVPSAGDVFYRGQDVFAMSRNQNLAFRKESAVVFQDSALWANQSLLQILELPLKIHYPAMSGRERLVRIKEVLAEAGYRKELNIRPSSLSMGEQKLIAFARAMLCRPELLFLDEWTESLDDDAARRLFDIVRRKKTEKNTIIFISHDLKVIEDLADQVLMINEGSLSLTVSGKEMSRDNDMLKMVEDLLYEV